MVLNLKNTYRKEVIMPEKPPAESSASRANKKNDPKSVITVIGESLVDVILDPHSRAEDTTHPGGSPLNVAVGTARLGLHTNLVTQFSDDVYGRIIHDHLKFSAVHVINDHNEQTSSALAAIGSDGAASYSFSVGWSLDANAPQVLSGVQEAAHVHAGSIAAMLPPGDQAVLSLVKAAREHATVSYDPNCRPALCPDVSAARRQAELFVAASDVVKASDEDLGWLYPDRSPEESMRAWLDLGPSFIVMTRGASGPVILWRHGRDEMAAEPIVLADTVGAGDSFMSTLISGLAQLGAVGASGRSRLRALTGKELRGLLDYANRAAAMTCSRSGANPPSVEQLGVLSVRRAPADS